MSFSFTSTLSNTLNKFSSTKIKKILEKNAKLIERNKCTNEKESLVQYAANGKLTVQEGGFINEKDLLSNFLGKETSAFITNVIGDFSFTDLNVSTELVVQA